VVLATALSIKMAGFIIGAPLVTAFAHRFSRRTKVAGLNLVRAGALILVPSVGSAQALYVLIAVFAVASAALNAVYQESVATLLPAEPDYSWALVKSRATYDLEGIAGPLAAMLLLTLVDHDGLFIAAVAILAAAMLLSLAVNVPVAPKVAGGGFLEVALRGVRTIATDPRLRGVPYLAVAVAAAVAMVAVNTVVLVQGDLGYGETATTAALAAFGIGSVAGAILVPRLLARRQDRQLMLYGTALSTAALILAAFVSGYPTLLVMWLAIGVGASIAQLPATLAVRSGARKEDYDIMFGGLLAITYGAYLVAYQISGRVAAEAGMDAAFVLLGAIAVTFALIASWRWSTESTQTETAGSGRADSPMSRPPQISGTSM
jgi:predicted MFS family arabinose efflux permease